MQLAFYKASGTIYDKLIRIFTLSKYSHCELVIDGRCYSSSPRDGGTRSKVIDLTDGKWDIVDVEGNSAEALAWFISNVPRKYDWLGAITSILPFHINMRNRFFCSQACALMLGIEESKSITPSKLSKRYM